MRFVLFAILLFVTACSSPPINRVTGHSKSSAANPTDAMLHADLQSFFKVHSHPLFSQYQYVRYDLNNDGRDGG